MIKPTKLSKIIVLNLAFLLCSLGLIAQTLNRPTPIRNPNFGGGGSAWTSACASVNFNEYFVNFTWSASPNVNSDNNFVLELSNGNGLFTNPVVLATITDRNNNTNFDIRFVLPTNTRGSNYKLRVKSTSPVLYSPETIGYNMFYIDYRSPIQITENGSGIIGNGKIAVCGGGTAVIAVDNVPNANTYQYIWRRSSTILADKGASITVSQAGMYTVEIDYGAVCSGSAGTLSNLITVETGNALGVTINPPAKTTFCAGETAAPLEATINNVNLFYTWYKNGVEVSSRTRGNFSYTLNTNTADFNGDYTVKVEGAGICPETTPAITIAKTGDFTITENNALDMVILPGQTKTLAVTATAASPTYQWFRNNTAISGATTSTLNTNQNGEYYVQVTQSGSCSATANSLKTIVVSPVSLELITAYATSYQDCQNSSIVLDVITINAIAVNGTKTNVTTDLKSSLSYQWKKDGVNVGGGTSSSISLTTTSENGLYTLDGVINSFTMASNSLSVALRSNETIIITASALATCNSSDQITINTPTDLTGDTFKWLKDGIEINTTDSALNTTETGKYQLVVSRVGCPVTSNEITIIPFDESLITLDSSLNVVFPEGSSKTVNAAGGTAYQWVDSNNNIISNTSSVSLTSEGTYTLTAYIDACVVLKQITVTYKDTFRIPNVITVNGDGINDLWLLPNAFSKNPEINVIIYNDKGIEIFNVNDYQNNWPESSTTFKSQNMLFYYSIRKDGDVLKQGTITVIK
jgi:hypothetical protein